MNIESPIEAPFRQLPELEAGLTLAGTPVFKDEPISILLVDDEPKNLTALETVLEDPEYRLVRAGSADEALLALVAGEFALLILDIQMPGMNGFELAQMIKQRKKTAGIPIIFLTAFFSEDQHVLEGYNTGAVDYLHKPINAKVLRSKVAVFADLHRKTRESAIMNRALFAEIAERRRAQQQLRELNDELEVRVAARTAELGEKQEAMREADKRKDEFLAMLGHELRNPLAAIRHAVRMEAESETDPASRRWASEVIDRQSNQLARMVDDLLDVERINRGRIELRLESLDLDSILARTAEAVRSLMDTKKHVLVIKAAPDLRVQGDAARLEQVFVNLFSNAAKYTGEGGRIEVSVRRQDAEAVISISDNGVGLAAEVLPRIFDLFTQAHTSLDRAQGGLGIGLTVVKSLVEMHGGAISVESGGVDQGSTFTVRLPLMPGASHPGESASENARTAVRSATLPTHLRVLVVDDHQDTGDTLSRLLSRRGYEVQTARNGLDGLKLASAFRPDVLLLDLGLPDLDGYELCRTLRSKPDFESARFIAISGYAQKADIERSLDAGFDAHFAKPVDFTTLLAAIQKREKEA